MPDFLSTGPAHAPCLILAHGAGAPMDSDFMDAISGFLADEGVRVMRFEFAYMAARRTSERKPPPPRADKLMAEFRSAIAEAGVDRPFIGGKSLGGRVASMCADELFAANRISGLVCLGYPFHPPGKPDSLRTAHLIDLTCPTLIAQGEKDPFGTADEVGRYGLSDAISIHWAPFGNHDLAPPKRSGRTAEDNWIDVAAAIARFVKAPG